MGTPELATATLTTQVRSTRIAHLSLSVTAVHGRFIFLAKAGHTGVDPRSGLRSATSSGYRTSIARAAHSAARSNSPRIAWNTAIPVGAPQAVPGLRPSRSVSARLVARGRNQERRELSHDHDWTTATVHGPVRSMRALLRNRPCCAHTAPSVPTASAKCSSSSSTRRNSASASSSRPTFLRPTARWWR